MKILPLVKDIKNDVTTSGIRLKQATADGYDIAIRTAQIYKLGNVKKYCNITKCIGQKVIKSTTIKEIPYVAGAVGLFIPLPLVSPLFISLGMLARITITKINMMHDKNHVSKKNNNSLV